MHKQGKLWALWLLPAIAGLVILSGTYATFGRTSADAHKELSIALQELRSQAAEAGLLAEHAGQGRLTGTFMRQQAHQLEKHMRAALAEVGEKGQKAKRPALTEQAVKQGHIALTATQQMASPATTNALGELAATLVGTIRELTRLDAELQRSQ